MVEEPSGVHYTERMVPEDAHARIFWDHIGRYRFAKDFVRGKRVLDVACGEGYGSSALTKAGAAAVIGIDSSAEVCARPAEIRARFPGRRCPGAASAGKVTRRRRVI